LRRQAPTKSQDESSSPESVAKTATDKAVRIGLAAPSTKPGPSDRRANTRDKLSINVNHTISERLRTLAYTYRLSESSIVEIALTIFFARGDDALLGVLLRQLGATRRSKS